MGLPMQRTTPALKAAKLKNPATATPAPIAAGIVGDIKAPAPKN